MSKRSLGASRQAVVHGNVRLVPAYAVQVQVHNTHPRRAVDDLPAVQRAVLQVVLLALVHLNIFLLDVVVGGQQESAGAAGGIADGHIRPRTHHLHDRLDERARREVLPRAGLHVLGVALQQRLVGVALHVGAEAHPVLAIYQLFD